MTESEINAIKGFIEYYNGIFSRCKSLQIKEEDILVDDDCERCKRVFNLIFEKHNWIDSHFNYYVFIKPLVHKLARKLFNYGVMCASDCEYYIYHWGHL